MPRGIDLGQVEALAVQAHSPRSQVDLQGTRDNGRLLLGLSTTTQGRLQTGNAIAGALPHALDLLAGRPPAH